MRRRPAAGLVLLALFSFIDEAAIRAVAQQQTLRLGPREDTPYEQRLVFTTDATLAARRPGGMGWATVEASNPDSSAHEVTIEVRETAARGITVSGSHIRLEPGESSRVVLPVPYTQWSNFLRVEVDGSLSTQSSIGTLSGGSTSTLPSLLALTDDAALGATLRQSVEMRLPEMVNGGTLLGFSVKRVRDLPDRWQMLSGFDAIVLDTRSEGLDAERQQVLADYVAAGGRLVVALAPRAKEGAVFAMLAEDLAAGTTSDGLGTGTHGRHGFGRWIVAATDETAFGAAVMAWLENPEFGGVERTLSGLPQDGLGSHLQIPGVGDVPRSMFLLLIVIFVGTVAILAFYLIRQRRHGRLLVVVPGTGVAFTGAILLYGFLSEGLGTKGVVRSITLLDQRRHEAVDVAQRTLYAGLAPSELPLEPGTLFVSWDGFEGEDRERVHHLQLDTTAGWVAGGEALPARLITHIATVSVCRPRERVRLRRAGSQRLELLPDAGLRPLARTGSLIVRDFDGAWWVSVQGEALRPMDAAECRARMAESLSAFNDFHPLPSAGWSEHRYSPHGGSSSIEPPAPHEPQVQLELVSWVSSLVPEDAPPGSYVMRVESDPCVDDLGLDVDWERREQLVIGRLAPEDLLE